MNDMFNYYCCILFSILDISYDEKNNKLVKLLDAFARGPFKNFKLVPNLYD